MGSGLGGLDGGGITWASVGSAVKSKKTGLLTGLPAGCFAVVGFGALAGFEGEVPPFPVQAGALVGLLHGQRVGELSEFAVGTELSEIKDGLSGSLLVVVSWTVGTNDGLSVVGAFVGPNVGADVGCWVGLPEGDVIGALVVGSFVGTSEAASGETKELQSAPKQNVSTPRGRPPDDTPTVLLPYRKA